MTSIQIKLAIYVIIGLAITFIIGVFYYQSNRIETLEKDLTVQVQVNNVVTSQVNACNQQLDIQSDKVAKYKLDLDNKTKELSKKQNTITDNYFKRQEQIDKEKEEYDNVKNMIYNFLP